MTGLRRPTGPPPGGFFVSAPEIPQEASAHTWRHHPGVQIHPARTMASLTRSESFTLPARATAVFLIGGAGSVTVDGSTSALGNQDVRVGPFTTAKTVSVSVTSGTVRYRLETVQAAPVLVTNDGDLVKPDGAGAGVSGGGGSTTVVDNLNSNSTSSALSANQGRVLAEGKAPRAGSGGALGATYTTTDADDAKIFTAASACTITVHAGAVQGFGLGVSGAGAVTFAGASGVTVTDKRATGSTNPTAALVYLAANTFEVWGTKA